MRWLDGITDSMDLSLRKLWELDRDDGQRSLACGSPWHHKELDVTERLNWTDSDVCKVIPHCSSDLYFSSN